MALKIDLKTLPSAAKTAIAVVPPVLVSAAVIFFLLMPKQKEIKDFEKKIDDQNNKISAMQAKAAKLDFLIKENDKLIKRLAELREYLPDEKEVSTLLKEVSDRALDAGLTMKSWRPGQKSTHPSGIVYEIPVSVTAVGTYHEFGKFLSSLTKLNRIVNVGSIQLSGAKAARGAAELQITFTASTFSAILDEETKKATEKKKI